jgi:type I restriction-modification system DNA methylase subunit
MACQSGKPLKARIGNGDKLKPDISIYGQESNYTTWPLAKMNLAIPAIDGQIVRAGVTFHNDHPPDLDADFLLANPPFNVSDSTATSTNTPRQVKSNTQEPERV